MRSSFAVLAGLIAAASSSTIPQLEPRQSDNPFSGRTLFVNPKYGQLLQQTRQAFESRGDANNAGKVKYVQDNVGTFVWISNIGMLGNIDDAIRDARAAQASGKKPIIGLVLYNIPDRDCSAGYSSGELSLNQNGLNRYRNEFVNPFAQKLKGASDLQFAVILEPDAIGNMVTGSTDFCRNARGPQEDGIAYAIQQLQANHIHLYLDVANGGWLGSSQNLGPTASEIRTILQKAGGSNRIRGYSTNVSNYNLYMTNNPPPFTAGSPSPDEFRYANSLANALSPLGLPTKFIVDQGRLALDGARSDWGTWCNVAPAGWGEPFTTTTQNGNVDALVWVKPGGESDGQCGMSGAPQAGSWFDAYAQMLATNAHSAIPGGGSSSGGGSNPSPGTNCAAKWDQCGGEGWTGATCCAEGSCTWGNQWYSQCK